MIGDAHFAASMVESDLFARYVRSAESLERFAGRIAASKHHALIVLQCVFKFLAWLGANYKMPQRTHIIERIFVP